MTVSPCQKYKGRRRGGRILRNERGVALLLTILIISLIYVLTVQFNTAMWSNLHAATNLKDSIQLGSMARSGFNAARAVIAVDGLKVPAVDSFHDAWANLAAISEYSAFFFEEGRFVVKVNDHSGRIQINALLKDGAVSEEQREMLARFLAASEFGLETAEVEGIVQALIDWLDEDDEVTGFGGAENLYYQTLENPYPPRNGPLESLEELLYVRGINPALYYGSQGQPGIAAFLTPYGTDGRVNINTAAPLVLRALAAQIDETVAADMVAWRDDEDNDLASADWYKTVPTFPGEVTIDSLVTISSTYFEVIAAGVKDDIQRSVQGMIYRKTNKTQILSWKIE